MTDHESRIANTARAMREAYAALLEELPLCLRCLGRTLGRVGHGLGNERRGELIAATIPWSEPEVVCPWCRAILWRIPHLAEHACELVEGHEFEHFEVGTRVFDQTREVEKRIAELGFEDSMEPIQREVNRGVGRLIEQSCGRPCRHAHPDLRVQVDPFHGRVRLRWKPIWIAGRYRKLERGIAQTRWGRWRGGVGKAPPESIEDLIGARAVELAGAEGATLHGAGREDVDVRMLGRGRPFVLELAAPRKRDLDLSLLEAAMETEPRVQARGLQRVERELIARFKGSGWMKSYASRITVAGEDPGRRAIEAALGRLVGGEIHQRTPERVSRRRADRVRRRRLHGARCFPLGAGRYGLLLLASSGLYIKEMIHGDEGRTRPSLAELLDRECECTSLDVLAVHDDPGHLERFRKRWFPASSTQR